MDKHLPADGKYFYDAKGRMAAAIFDRLLAEWERDIVQEHMAWALID